MPSWKGFLGNLLGNVSQQVITTSPIAAPIQGVIKSFAGRDEMAASSTPCPYCKKMVAAVVTLHKPEEIDTSDA